MTKDLDLYKSDESKIVHKSWKDVDFKKRQQILGCWNRVNLFARGLYVKRETELGLSISE